MSTLSVKRELDAFGIPYNEADIIDGDKVIAAMKKENNKSRLSSNSRMTTKSDWIKLEALFWVTLTSIRMSL